MTDLGVFTTRVALPDDYRFIAASWFESFWKATAHKAGADLAVYRASQGALIETLIQRSRCLVVAATAVPDEIAAYAVCEGLHVHYVYVKAAWRKMGLAKGLLRGGVTRYTHSTRAGNRVARALGLTFDPWFLLRERV